MSSADRLAHLGFTQGRFADRPASLNCLVFGAVLALLFLLPTAASARVVVSLEFDDATADQAQLGPELADRGLRATFFVNSGLLGTKGFLTQEQLLGLQAQGNEIGGHTTTHAELPGLTPEMQEAEVCDDRKALAAMGFAVTDFAYPSGAYSPLTKGVVSSCGYQSARTVGFVVCRGCRSAETLPPLDPFATRTRESVTTWTTLTQLKRAVLKAERGRRVGWLQIVFHQICEGCTQGSISPPVLGIFLDWLRLRSAQTPVMTVREALARTRFRTPRPRR